jgi:addiction module HigA family antidote
MTVQKLSPLHPGEVLLEEFMLPMGISQNQLGRDLGVTPRRINEIVHGKRAVTADTALRLARYFGTSAQFWMGLQSDYDLETAEDKLSEKIAQEVKRSRLSNFGNSERLVQGV